MRHFLLFSGYTETLDEIMEPLVCQPHRPGLLLDLAYKCTSAYKWKSAKLGEDFELYLNEHNKATSDDKVLPTEIVHVSCSYFLVP